MFYIINEHDSVNHPTPVQASPAWTKSLISQWITCRWARLLRCCRRRRRCCSAAAAAAALLLLLLLLCCCCCFPISPAQTQAPPLLAPCSLRACSPATAMCWWICRAGRASLPAASSHQTAFPEWSPPTSGGTLPPPACWLARGAAPAGLPQLRVIGGGSLHACPPCPASLAPHLVTPRSCTATCLFCSEAMLAQARAFFREDPSLDASRYLLLRADVGRLPFATGSGEGRGTERGCLWGRGWRSSKGATGCGWVGGPERGPPWAPLRCAHRQRTTITSPRCRPRLPPTPLPDVQWRRCMQAPRSTAGPTLRQRWRRSRVCCVREEWCVPPPPYPPPPPAPPHTRTECTATPGDV